MATPPREPAIRRTLLLDLADKNTVAVVSIELDVFAELRVARAVEREAGSRKPAVGFFRGCLEEMLDDRRGNDIDVLRARIEPHQEAGEIAFLDDWKREAVVAKLQARFVIKDGGAADD